MSSTLLFRFSSPGAGDYSLSKSIRHPDPSITSAPPPVLITELLVSFTSPFPDGQPSADVRGLQHLSVAGSSQTPVDLLGFIQSVLSLWLMSSSKALWCGFGNDSLSSLRGIDAETHTPRVAEPPIKGVLDTPCLGQS